MEVKNEKSVKIKYNNWTRFLEIIYGDKPSEVELFFKHTYLSIFVKLLVHLKISKGRLVVRKEQISSIIYGDLFLKAGILNFMEEDFFVWFFYPSLRTKSNELIYTLMQELLVYDIDKIDEDILKELYQELIDPVQRKLLGEFYTPDWLADLIVEDVLKDNPFSKVLDPSCGSGTFLFKAIKYKINALTEKGLDKASILKHILENVIGFDVHPLAVTIAKTNYLLSLKDLINIRKESISIPVYLSDSLRLPMKTDPKLYYQNDLFEFQTVNDKKFLFPSSIAGNFVKMDDIVDKIRNHAHVYENIINRSKISSTFRKEELVNNVISSFERAVSNIPNRDDRRIVVENLKIILNLIDDDSNSIWTYILRNMYKPVAINYNKVDVIIGNPPWSTLQNMKDENYQNYLKLRSKYYGLTDKAQNITHLEIATLFFCQCVNQYLRKDGIITFVMPRTVLVSSHHEKFLKFAKPQIKLLKIYDLEKVYPLF